MHQALHHKANASSPRIIRAARLGATRLPNPQASEYPNVFPTTLHNSHSHAPRDAKYVVPARYGAHLCTK